VLTEVLKREYRLSLFPSCKRHRQNSGCCLGWQKIQSLLPNWPREPFCNRPKLIHTPHDIIYKEVEGTFVRAQNTSGLFEENIHLEVEE